MEQRLWPEETAASAAPAEASKAGAADSIQGLTTRMKRGEEAAYREFYAQFGNRLLRYLLVVTRGNNEEAREALQLTMVRVVRYLKVFREEEVLWSWLTVLARSAVRDEGRKRSRYFRFIQRFVSRGITDTVPGSEPEERLDRALEEELARLPPDEREIVDRKYFTGERVSEIASALGLTEKAVESRLVRIRRKLKQSILKDLGNEE